MTYNSYDSYDTTAQYDTSWGEIASPAGSGAMLTSGETFMGTYENEEQMDEYDMEVEQEDEEALALFREEQGLDQNCYLAQAYTYAIAGGSPTVGSTHVLRFNVFGYQFTSQIPPSFDGSDLTNWIRAAYYWMDNSTLQEKNKCPAIVQNLSGLATRWIERLNKEICLCYRVLADLTISLRLSRLVIFDLAMEGSC